MGISVFRYLLYTIYIVFWVLLLKKITDLLTKSANYAIPLQENHSWRFIVS